MVTYFFSSLSYLSILSYEFFIWIFFNVFWGNLTIFLVVASNSSTLFLSFFFLFCIHVGFFQVFKIWLSLFTLSLYFPHSSSFSISFLHSFSLLSSSSIQVKYSRTLIYIYFFKRKLLIAWKHRMIMGLFHRVVVMRERERKELMNYLWSSELSLCYFFFFFTTKRYCNETLLQIDEFLMNWNGKYSPIPLS